MYFLTAVSLFSLALAAPIPQGTTSQMIPGQQPAAQQPGAIAVQPSPVSAPVQPEVIAQSNTLATQGLPPSQPAAPAPQVSVAVTPPTVSAPSASSASPVGKAPPAKAEKEEVDKWTVAGYTRTCDTANTICTVRFQIDEQDGSFNPATAPFCRISLAGSSGAVPLLPQPADGCPEFSVASQWDPKGFTVLSVVNKE